MRSIVKKGFFTLAIAAAAVVAMAAGDMTGEWSYFDPGTLTFGLGSTAHLKFSTSATARFHAVRYQRSGSRST